MKLALYQGAGFPEAPDNNLDILQQVAYEAAGHGADLLVMPALWLSGVRPGRKLDKLAETADGPGAQRAAEIARGAGIALLYGYPEATPRGLYNAALLIDAAGRSLAGWRAGHLHGEADKARFRPGEREPSVIPLAGLKLGILVGYDVEFPESVRALALAGADLVAVPAALSSERRAIADILVPARALENHIHLAFANRSGQEGKTAYCGLSAVVAPDGSRPAQAGAGEALIFAEIEPAGHGESAESASYLDDRRPALYRRLSGGDKA